MPLERYTQKERREIMERHGHERGVALEYFGPDGKPQIFIQTFGSEKDMAAFVELHNSQMDSRNTRRRKK